jgi:predicted transcriptional regulator
MRYKEARLPSTLPKAATGSPPPRRRSKADEPLTTPIIRELAAKIVVAYVRNNRLAPDQIGGLISSVCQALANLETPTVNEEVQRTPAVPIRQSVRPDYVVCLDCGWRGRMLRRHLSAAHGLTVQEYRARWDLPADHAVIAPEYSARRSAMARRAGLGRTA